MNPLSKNVLLCCMLLLAACANQDQSQMAAQASLPPIEQAAEHAAGEAKPAVAANKEQSGLLRQEDRLSVVGEATRNRSQERAAAPAPESRKMIVGDGATAYMAVPATPYIQEAAPEREQYGALLENPIRQVTESPVSTFSIDVDTGSYANVRRMLNAGRLPPADAVRVEEMINYFPYAYALPKDNAPFAVHTEIAPAPWNAKRHLLRIGIKGQDMAKACRQPIWCFWWMCPAQCIRPSVCPC